MTVIKSHFTYYLLSTEGATSSTSPHLSASLPDLSCRLRAHVITTKPAIDIAGGAEDGYKLALTYAPNVRGQKRCRKSNKRGAVEVYRGLGLDAVESEV